MYTPPSASANSLACRLGGVVVLAVGMQHGAVAANRVLLRFGRGRRREDHARHAELLGGERQRPAVIAGRRGHDRRVSLSMPSLIRNAAFMAPRILNELVRLSDSIFRNTLPSAIDDNHDEGRSGVLGRRAPRRRRAS